MLSSLSAQRNLHVTSHKATVATEEATASCAAARNCQLPSRRKVEEADGAIIRYRRQPGPVGAEANAPHLVAVLAAGL